MNNYTIITDSSCDLPDSLVKELELEVLPLAFIMDGKTYRNYPDNREMAPKDFYNKQREGSMATTNAVNVGEAADAMEDVLKRGEDVLVLAFSSGLSTTCNSFQIAAGDLAEQYPDRKIFVVDTLCASLGQGMFVYQAARLRQAGRSMEEVRDWAEQNKLNQCHWFTVNDLFFLKKGGRVSAATAVVGTMLQIKPVMHVDNEGHLIKVDTARGRKASLNALVDKVGELADNPAAQTMFISNSDCQEDAQYVADQIKARYGTEEIIINSIGPVIGAHTGPGCVALFFTGKHR
ncbi:MAG: DegV family protein [Oscillospiraceae bacterium]|jgi:DegV family protein with EDD domain|nr:DegV family protein [Oscillospiraceae bacterium]